MKFKKEKFHMPSHIAFIMDGNGRWANKRGMPRTAGHKFAVSTVKNLIRYCLKYEMKVVSLFAFSTENWKRPKEEVDFLFDLLCQFFNEGKQLFLDNNVKLMIMGDYKKTPKKVVDAIDEILTLTKNNNGLILNIGFNYGARGEIIRAVNMIKADNVKVNEETFKDYLWTKDLPDPDLVVRTSGEERLSNFMLYQSAYSELYFTKTYWPDFNEKTLIDAFKSYSKRHRRFGALEKEEK